MFTYAPPNRLFFLILFFFSVATPLLPSSAEAALVPCGRTTGTASEQAPCTICHVIVGGKGLIDYALQIMTITAIAIIVAMGIFYIISTGSDEMMSKAKGGIKAALIGFAVMLSAWLIINVILTLLVNAQFLSNIKQGGTFSFSCDTASLAGTGTPSSGSTVTGSATNQGGSSGPGTRGGGPGSSDTTPPTIPTDLRAIAISSSQIDLSFTASTDATGVTAYTIYRGGTLLVILGGGVLTYSDTGLTPNTAYTYSVQAQDAAGNKSEQSAQVAATTQTGPPPSDTEAPSTPAWINAQSTGGTEITLSWDTSSDDVGVVKYNLFRDGVLVYQTTTLPPQTSYKNTGLTLNTSYTYTVQAEDAAGNKSQESPAVVGKGKNTLPVVRDINGNAIPDVTIGPFSRTNTGADDIRAWKLDPNICNASPSITEVLYYGIDWEAYKKLNAIDLFALRPNQAMVYKWVVPTRDVSGGFNYNDNTVATVAPTFMSISKQPCDFDVTKITSRVFDNTTSCYQPGLNGNTISWANISGTLPVSYCRLKKGETYYLNIRFQDVRPRRDETDRTPVPFTDACQSIPGQRCGGLLQVN